MLFKFTTDFRNAKKIGGKLYKSGLIKGLIGAFGIGAGAYLLERGAIERATGKTSDNLLDCMENVDVDDNWDQNHNVKEV